MDRSTAMSDTEDDFFSMIEVDAPAPAGGMLAAPRQIPAPAPSPATSPAPSPLAAIAAESSANAAATGIGSRAGGQLRAVGFANADGYIQALRNGVPTATYVAYLETLRARFGMTTADLQALSLPPPMAEVDLPVGAGITHTPTGPSVFDRPAAERKFTVGAQPTQTVERVVQLSPTQLVAGAAAEGSHAIVAWEGTSGLTLGTLRAALDRIGLGDWAPSSPSARAQAGVALQALSAKGFVVRAARRSHLPGLDTNHHVWSVGRVHHLVSNEVGAEFGKLNARFTLAGDKLSYVGDASIGAPVVAVFSAALAAETLKSSDVTGWLGRSLSMRCRAVRFGAMGWLVPSRHVATARKLVEATRSTGFGSGWVTGLPVATSDDLRAGIAGALREEASGLLARLATENAAAESGKIGERRAQTFLRDMREVGARALAYAAILGDELVASVRSDVRTAIAQLESYLGDDYTGIGARFDAVWQEIADDVKRTGDVL